MFKITTVVILLILVATSFAYSPKTKQIAIELKEDFDYDAFVIAKDYLFDIANMQCVEVAELLLEDELFPDLPYQEMKYILSVGKPFGSQCSKVTIDLVLNTMEVCREFGGDFKNVFCNNLPSLEDHPELTYGYCY